MAAGESWEVCLCQRVQMPDGPFFLPSLNWALITNLTVQSRTLVLTLTVSLMREKSDKQQIYTRHPRRPDRDGELDTEKRNPSAVCCLSIAQRAANVFLRETQAS